MAEQTRKRLLVLPNAFDPDRGGGAAVYSDMCFDLAKTYDVTVVAPYPFYPEWEDKSGRNGLGIWHYEDRGVDVWRVGMFIPGNPRSAIQRILFEGTLMLSLLRMVPLARKHDAVMVFCPQVANLVAATLMKFFYNKPLWLNLQDMVSSAAGATGITGSRLSRFSMGIESWLYNRCDVWSTISLVMRDRIEKLRRRGQTFLLIPNWVDRPLSDALAETPRQERVLGTPLRLLYAGNLGAKQDFLTLCKVLSASKTNFHFKIYFGGGGAREVIDWVASNGDTRFETGPFLNAKDFAIALKSADFYVITEKRAVAASFFPSKTVAGMSAGTPILAVCDADSPLGREMEEASLGLRMEWDDIEKLPSILDELALENAMPKLAAWHQNALKRARFFDRNMILDRLRLTLDAFLSREPIPTSQEQGDLGPAEAISAG